MAKRTNRVAWALVGVLAVVLCVRTGGSILQEHVELGLEAGCLSGLRETKEVFLAYQDRHGGRFPQRLDELDLTAGSADTLRCPKAPDSGRRAYLYIPPRLDTPADTPILLCWRHPGLVLLTKGLQTEWLPDSDGPAKLVPATTATPAGPKASVPTGTGP